MAGFIPAVVRWLPPNDARSHHAADQRSWTEIGFCEGGSCQQRPQFPHGPICVAKHYDDAACHHAGYHALRSDSSSALEFWLRHEPGIDDSCLKYLPGKLRVLSDSSRPRRTCCRCSLILHAWITAAGSG